MRMAELINGQQNNLLPLPTPWEEFPTSLWYIIHTRSRHEVKVEADLTRKGLQTFLPKLMVRSRRRDRLQILETPLFPGYLFVRTDLNEWAHYNINRTFGVVRILGIKGFEMATNIKEGRKMPKVAKSAPGTPPRI